MRHRRSLASLLALAYCMLVIYASLYPFAGWRWPVGAGLSELLGLPWSPWWQGFDVISNLLGYLPLGALLFASLIRSGRGLRVALLLGLTLPSALSFAMETLQHFLPRRAPSLADWGLNSAGAVLGALMALLVHVLGGLERWQSLRDRWFVPTSEGGLAMLLLWPVGLLFPAPMPMGLGQVSPLWMDLKEGVMALFHGTPWQLELGDGAGRSVAEVSRALPPGLEVLAIALGVLAPCVIALSVATQGWRKYGLVMGVSAVGLLVTAFSTAMSFGPQHAMAWMSDPALLGFALGVAMALALCMVPARAAAALGLVSITALIALVNMAPPNPYFSQNLALWEQGKFIRFHGVAQWVGWVWPFVALGWLLVRVGRRDSR